MVSFNIDEIIKTPILDSISSYDLGDIILYIAKDNPNWIALDKSESILFESILNGFTLRESISVFMSETKKSEFEAVETATLILQRIQNNEFYQLDGIIKPERKIPIHFYTTHNCNLSCSHCYMDAGSKLENELTFPEIERFLEDVTSFGKTQITLSGGEPMLRSDFFEICNSIKDKGHKLALLTNGTLIDEKNIDRLSELVDYLQLSLEGVTRDVHDRVRGRGNFERVLEVIKLLSESGQHISLNITMSENNIEDLKDNFRNLVEDRFNDSDISFNFGKTIEYGRASCKKNYDSDFEDIVKELSEYLWSKGWSRRSTTRNVQRFNCGFGEAFVLNSNGDVYPCPVIDKIALVGNILKNPLKILFNRISELNEETSVQRTDCHDSCDLEYICSGGCRIENLRKKGDFRKVYCTDEIKSKYIRALAYDGLLSTSDS